MFIQETCCIRWIKLFLVIALGLVRVFWEVNIFFNYRSKKIQREYGIEISIFENIKTVNITWAYVKKTEFLVKMLCTATLTIKLQVILYQNFYNSFRMAYQVHMNGYRLSLDSRSGSKSSFFIFHFLEIIVVTLVSPDSDLSSQVILDHSS